MTAPKKTLLLLSLLSLTALLTGCPGMPGAPGSAQANLPPGMKAPPGMESGGGRTLMGTTITAPDNAVLLVKHVRPSSGAEAPWQSCRRVMVLEDCILIEGINYDQRIVGAERDSNEVVPFSDMQSFVWKYELKPAPPPEESAAEEKSE